MLVSSRQVRISPILMYRDLYVAPHVYSTVSQQLFSPADRPHVSIRPSQNRGPGTALASPICRYFPSLCSHVPLTEASVDRQPFI